MEANPNDRFIRWMDRYRTRLNAIYSVVSIVVFRYGALPLLALLMAANTHYFQRKGQRFETGLFGVLTLILLGLTLYAGYWMIQQ